MSHERDLLHLEPSPTSARQARSVVASRLRDLGREDLLDSASLVVSELVTNALLHAGDSITLRVRGTARRPRIEVGDSSMGLPRLPTQVDDLEVAASADDAALDDPVVDDDLLLTYGRGVRLVQIHSAAWGVDRSSGSKVVWFEPAAEPRPRALNEIQVFEIGEPDSVLPPSRRPADRHDVSRHSDPSPDPAAPLHRVRLLNAPVRLVDSVRRHYDELQREIRLIGLQYGTERSALPRELFEQASRPELHRLSAIGTEQVADGALDRGDGRGLAEHRPQGRGLRSVVQGG